MSRSKYSPQQGKENKTVPSREEQSSQASSWWPLALIALCAVTITLDKRKPHPSTVPTELQDKKPKRGQTESTASDKRHVWDKWNPQTWGNCALVLIQAAILSLFQVALFGLESNGLLIRVLLCAFLVIGVFIFLETTTLEGAKVYIFFGVLILAFAISTLPSFLQLPDFPESAKICARLNGADLDLEKMCAEIERARQGLSHKGVWLAGVCVGQTVVLLLSWWASTKIKSAWKRHD